MITNFNDSHMTSVAQLKEFVKISQEIKFQGTSRKGKYQWIEDVLNRFRYFGLRKKEKMIVKKYLMKMSDYSDAQITRLIAKKKRCGKIIADSTGRHKFSTIYTPKDIALIITTDRAHQHLSGPATKSIFEREYDIYHKREFVHLKNISVSHLYNLRETRQYRSHCQFFTKTRPTRVPIGERRKPDPGGYPGFIRVDTVHQGDLEGEKGVYHLNLVDEIIQWEIVGAVEKISERYLVPLLEKLIQQFPFRIINFHSDNGSEFINKVVHQLLNKLLIKQTKSRARHCNDNAIVEGKNGSIIRKKMGYGHIPQRYAIPINQFYQKYFNIYLNYHHPCAFATLIVDKRGKEKKVYRQKDYQTPYQKLKSFKRAEQYLKEGITFQDLDKIAMEKSDNEWAVITREAKKNLFKKFKDRFKLPTNYSVPTIIPPDYANLISGSYLD